MQSRSKISAALSCSRHCSDKSDTEFSNFKFGAAVFNPNTTNPPRVAASTVDLNTAFEIRTNTRCRGHIAAETEMLKMAESQCASKCMSTPNCQARLRHRVTGCLTFS